VCCEVCYLSIPTFHYVKFLEDQLNRSTGPRLHPPLHLLKTFSAPQIFANADV
jgi:hypothetical protein